MDGTNLDTTTHTRRFRNASKEDVIMKKIAPKGTVYRVTVQYEEE